MAASYGTVTEDQRRESLDRRHEIFLRAKALDDAAMMPALTGFEDQATKDLLRANQFLRQAGMPSLKPLLPLLLKLKGKPYTLDNYFPFEPFFRTRMAKSTILKTGRQVSKSTSLAAQGIAFSNSVPFFATLYVTPLFEMVRRFSHNYVRQFLEESPVRRLFLGNNTTNSVLQRTYRNGSSMYFSYAFLDAERTRGIPADKNVIDEIQDMNYDFLQIIHETLSGSPWGLTQYAGTPKCAPLDSPVLTPHGIRMLGDLRVGDTVLAWSGSEFVAAKVTAIWLTGHKQCWKLRTENGRSARTSPDHRLLTVGGYRPMSEISTGDLIATYSQRGRFEWSRVESIEVERHEVPTCDIEVTPHHNFVQSGIVSHNSLDNSCQKLWTDSSQAEWMIKCDSPGCGHWNVPASDWDLLDMIGPWHRDISDKIPAVVCSQCATPTGHRKPLNPRNGRWVHRFPERRWKFAGYHVPQQIMPMHYGNPEKWDALLGKQQGRNNTTPTTFLNEVCGEACDAGAKLVTETELRAAACLPWRRKAAEATKHLNRYKYRVLSIDWGGGGGKLKSSGGAAKGGDVKRERTSFTAYAVLGIKHNGEVEVIWGHRSIRTHDWHYEAQLALEALTRFKCSHIVHDYSGAGEGRLVMLYQSGLPPRNIINIRYQGFGHSIMNHHPATEDHPHDWYSIDKSRSLVTCCLCIKFGLIKFFQYDYESADNPGLIQDFLALIEEKVDTRIGSDAYVIVRNPNSTDDFAHAVNMGACSLWWLSKKWPNVAAAAKFKLSAEVMKYVHPMGKVDWADF